MTAQQLSHFRSALTCLFDQATGKPSPFASDVLLSPWRFRFGAVLLLPVTHPHIRFRWPPTPTAARLGTPFHPLRPARRHSIPIAPAPCERLSPTAF
jgi:hypothetical protein